MHRQQLTHVISIERNEVGDLFPFGLGHLESLASFDLEADVSSRRQGNRVTRVKNGGCAAHDAKDLPESGLECTASNPKPTKELRCGKPLVTSENSLIGSWRGFASVTPVGCAAL